MRGARGWVLLAILAIAVAAAAYAGQPRQDSPEHSSNSDAANGTSAARLFAQAMGHPTDQMASFAPPSGGLMFVFNPTSPYTADEADRTAAWVSSGGVLVYASEPGDPELDRALSVGRFNGLVSSDVANANPTLQGVNQVVGGSLVSPLNPGPSQVPIVRTPSGFALAYRQRLDTGTIFVLADPLMLCNGYLDKQDNGAFLSDLLGTVAAAAPVAFDEYHHGLIVSDLLPQQWVTTPWGAALLWLIVALFAGLLLRGRTFGPQLPRPVEAARAETEWAVAVGNLLRRSGARLVTLGLLASASERAVAARTGLPVQPRERFWNALHGRAPELATELAEAERALYGAAGADADLLKAAQRLHRIAYPVSPATRTRAGAPPPGSTKEVS
jgi:hypothetical protein